MFKLVVALLLCGFAYVKPTELEIDPYVVGGTPAKEGQYPFIVSLRQLNSSGGCGGALISNRYILTAAHCVSRNTTKPMRIGAGSIFLDSQKIYDVDKIIIHPGFEPVKDINDIAILRLKTPIELIPGKIETINYPVTENLDGKNVTAMGWGRTSLEGQRSNTLLTLNRPIINNKECIKRLNLDILDSQMCLGCEKNFGMCFGDSGSPLLYKGVDGKNYISGIFNWGIPCAQGYPDVFTRVSSFIQWIKQNTV